MADTKLTALTALTGANVATNDLLYIGDVSATTAGSKSITIQEFLTAILGSTSKTGATETTSKPLLNLAQTWNDGAVTFTGLKLNVTDTASAAASLLMDLQVGGSSVFSVSKAGVIQGSGTTSIAAYGTIRFSVDATTTSILNDLYLFTGQKIIWNNDAYISRKGAGNLQLGAADGASPVAQILSTQGNTTTNGNGVSLTIKAGAGDGSGTGGALYLDGGISGAAGTGGAIIFRTAPAAAGGTLATALTIDSTKLATFAGAVTVTGSVTGVNWFGSGDVRAGASKYIYWDTRTSLISPADGSMQISNGAETNYAVLAADAANTLALRNGTNAQAFNVYNTYTSGTSYERLSINYDSGNSNYWIAMQKGSGGGSYRNLSIGIQGHSNTIVFDQSSQSVGICGGTGLWSGVTWYFSGANGNFLAGTDKTFDFGDSTHAARDIYIGRNLIPTATFATNQTTGFINIPGAAGAPSGTPANTTGFPIYWDSTNNKLYVYDGGWLASAAFT